MNFPNNPVTLLYTFSSSQENENSIFHTKATKIIPLCPQCQSIPDLVWSWRVLEISSYVNFTTESEVENITLNASELFLPANILQPNSVYRILLNATSYAGNVSGYLSYELRTNDIPRSGYCDIKPFESKTLLNAFQTNCHAWFDRDTPLSYEYLYSIDELEYSLFYRGQHPDSRRTFFKTGLPERDYRISVKVIIWDGVGESAVQVLTVKVSWLMYFNRETILFQNHLHQVTTKYALFRVGFKLASSGFEFRSVRKVSDSD